MDLHLTEEQEQAIRAAVDREDSIYELEYLGVTIRNLNDLEASDFEIETIIDLLALHDHEILSIKNVGEKTLHILKEALRNYHKIPEMKEKAHYKIKRLKKKQGK